MKYLLLFCCYSFLQLNAQIGIYITSEYPFELGIDGYVQNTESVKKLAVLNLDTSMHSLWLNITDGERKISFNRQLKLVRKGNHHYIITKNFKGDLQLRYRGSIHTIPAGIITMKQQSLLPLPEDALAVNQNTSINDILKNQESEIIENPDKEIIPPPAELNMDITPDTIEPELEVDKFPALLEEIGKAEFEFLKLNMAKEFADSNGEIDVEQLSIILKTLSYDNSRLQLITYCLEKIEPQEKLNLLENSLDYELSKEALKNIISKNDG